MTPLLFFFFLIAFAYSAAGFAGGSSYLMALTLAGWSQSQSAPVALACNLAVSAIGIWNFHRAGYLRLSFVMPFAALSVPMAFLGSQVHLPKKVFLFLLGTSLAIAALRLFISRVDIGLARPLSARELWKRALPTGALLGFFSGAIGIGGGIFLSPLIILSGWAPIAEASAAACFFIFVNSFSGLLGKIQIGAVLSDALPLLLFSALCGGWLGSRLGTKRLPEVGMRRVLAALLLFVSANLLLNVF